MFTIKNSIQNLQKLCYLLNCCAFRGVLIQRKCEQDAHMLWNLNDDTWEKRIFNLAKHQDLALNYCNCQVQRKATAAWCPVFRNGVVLLQSSLLANHKSGTIFQVVTSFENVFCSNKSKTNFYLFINVQQTFGLSLCGRNRLSWTSTVLQADLVLIK